MAGVIRDVGQIDSSVRLPQSRTESRRGACCRCLFSMLRVETNVYKEHGPVALCHETSSRVWFSRNAMPVLLLFSLEHLPLRPFSQTFLFPCYAFIETCSAYLSQSSALVCCTLRACLLVRQRSSLLPSLLLSPSRRVFVGLSSMHNCPAIFVWWRDSLCIVLFFPSVLPSTALSRQV